MSCEGYVLNREHYAAGMGRAESQNDVPLIFDDDHDLLDYLLEQEHLAEQNAIVSYDSYTSD